MNATHNFGKSLVSAAIGGGLIFAAISVVAAISVYPFYHGAGESGLALFLVYARFVVAMPFNLFLHAIGLDQSIYNPGLRSIYIYDFLNVVVNSLLGAFIFVGARFIGSVLRRRNP